MANTSINSLAIINASSVTDLSSLFFYGINNGNSRLVPATVLATFMGTQLGCTVHVTSADVPLATQSYDTVAPYTVDLDTAAFDTIGGFDTNTPGIVKTTFDGWVQCFAGVGFQTTSISQGARTHRARVLKNGVHTLGYADTIDRFYYTGTSSHQSAFTFWSAPMTCAIDDEFSLNVGIETDSFAYKANGDTFLSIRPLSVVVGS